MALRVDSLKGEIIEKVVGAVRTKLSGKKAAAAETFVRRFYENVAPGDIVSEDAEDLYGAALSLWNFAAIRQPGEAKIRVYNPQFDRDGWHSPHTVIEIVHTDMPFLVDSVTVNLSRRGLAVHQVIHPIFAARRDRRGKAIRFSAPQDAGADAVRESCMHMQIDEQPDDATLKNLEAGLRAVLADVRAAVEDWPSMRQHIVEEIERLKKNPPKLPKSEIEEGIAFLTWLYDDHFTFLGYRELSFTGRGKNARMEVVPNSGRGVLRDPDVPVFDGLRNLGAQTPEVRAFVRQPKLLMIAKANQRASVHRSVHMDTIAIKLFDKKGKVVGEQLFVGLFTSTAYSETPTEIPLLRKKVAAVVRNAGFDAGSHDGKALNHMNEEYPRNTLFQSTQEELTEIAQGIVRLQERQRIALFLRRDPYERYISALIYLPRERLNTRLRRAFDTILARALNGTVRAFYTHVADEPLDRLLFIVKTTPGAVPDFDRAEIEQRLVEAARTWEDRLKQALVENLGEARGNQLFNKYESAFPSGYREAYSAQTAVFDIVRFEEAFSSGALGMNLYRPIEAEDHEVSFKIYNVGDAIPCPISCRGSKTWA